MPILNSYFLFSFAECVVIKAACKDQFYMCKQFRGTRPMKDWKQTKNKSEVSLLPAFLQLVIYQTGSNELVRQNMIIKYVVACWLMLLFFAY